MAEVGPSRDVSDKSKSEMGSHLSACPICLEQLHQPKSLPCLHSFCQECLSIFITKDLSGKMASATAFPCPICRKMTNPVNAAEDKEKWAEQFPTNDLNIGLVKETEHKAMYCKPCEKKGNTGTPATVLCKTCNVLFCDNCKVEYHDLILEGCETVEVSGEDVMVQRQVTKKVRCGKHTKKMDYYCEDDQTLGCSRCITIDHRRCDVVTTTQEYCDKLKRESRLDDLKMSLKKTTEAIEILVKEFGEQLQTLLEDQDTGLKSLADLRQRIDTRLDAMQKNVTDELIATYKKEKENLEMSLQKCERLMFSIQNTIESSGSAVERNDSVNTILLYQRGQAEVRSYGDLVTEIRQNFTSVRIKHIVDPKLLTLDTDFPLSMGSFKTEQNPSRLPDPVLSLLPECGVTDNKVIEQYRMSPQPQYPQQSMYRPQQPQYPHQSMYRPQQPLNLIPPQPYTGQIGGPFQGTYQYPTVPYLGLGRPIMPANVPRQQEPMKENQDIKKPKDPFSHYQGAHHQTIRSFVVPPPGPRVEYDGQPIQCFDNMNQEHNLREEERQEHSGYDEGAERQEHFENDDVEERQEHLGYDNDKKGRNTLGMMKTMKLSNTKDEMKLKKGRNTSGIILQKSVEIREWIGEEGDEEEWPRRIESVELRKGKSNRRGRKTRHDH